MTDVIGDIFDPLVQSAVEFDEQGVEAEKNGKWATAIQRYRTVFEIFRVCTDKYGIQKAQALSNLALAHQNSGNLEEARNYFAQSIAMLVPMLGSEKGKPIIVNTEPYLGRFVTAMRRTQIPISTRHCRRLAKAPARKRKTMPGQCGFVSQCAIRTTTRQEN